MTIRLGVCVKAHRLGQTWEELQTPGQPELTAGSRSALEGALRLKATLATAELVVFGLGPAEIQTALRACLAGGAGRALHLMSTDERADGWATALGLAQAVREEKLSLILCGEDPGSAQTGEVPVFLAEILDLPLATQVLKLELEPGAKEARIQRSLGRGRRENLAVPLPAVVMLSPAAFPPRYLSIYQRSREDCGRLETRPAGSEAARTTCLEINPARPRPRKISAPAASLSAAERMKFLLSGGKKNDETKSEAVTEAPLFEGSPDEAAERLYQFLSRRGFLNNPPAGDSDRS